MVEFSGKGKERKKKKEKKKIWQNSPENHQRQISLQGVF